MAQVEVLLKTFEICQSSIVNRLRQRDAILLVFMTFCGTIFVFVNKGDNKDMLLVIPLFGLGCAFLLAYHTVMLESMIRFLTEDLYPKLGKDIACLELSRGFLETGMMGVRIRSIGYSFILMIPSLISISINLGEVEHWLIVASILALLLSLGLVFYFDNSHVKAVRARAESNKD